MRMRLCGRRRHARSAQHLVGQYGAQRADQLLGQALTRGAASRLVSLVRTVEKDRTPEMLKVERQRMFVGHVLGDVHHREDPPPAQ